MAEGKAGSKKRPAWDGCLHWLPRKNRYCRLSRDGGSEYCGEHDPWRRSERVPCPLDASHLVRAADLKRHVRVCPVAKKRKRLGDACRMGINGGAMSPEDAAAIAAAGDVPDDEVAGEAAVFARVCGGLPPVADAVDLSPEFCRGYLEAHATAKDVRHRQQQVSIMASMRSHGLLDSKFTFLEMGAGRGMLSMALAYVVKPCTVVLVDRAAPRHKADSHLKDLPTCSFSRMQADIFDLWLPGAPELANAACVMLSKHLCGAATDVSLRCAVSANATPEGAAVEGFAIATCCHHSCTWEAYVGKDWWLSQGLTPVDFVRASHFSSWALGAVRHGEGGDTRYGVPPAELRAIGWTAKRVIDAGRLAYAVSSGFTTATVVRYCPPEVSPEGFLIMGRRAAHPKK